MILFGKIVVLIKLASIYIKTKSFNANFVLFNSSFEFNIDDMSPDIPPSTLVSDLKSLVNNEILSDVTFMIEGQYVHAHKVMLMRWVETLPSIFEATVKSYI